MILFQDCLNISLPTDDFFDNKRLLEIQKMTKLQSDFITILFNLQFDLIRCESL